MPFKGTLQNNERFTVEVGPAGGKRRTYGPHDFLSECDRKNTGHRHCQCATRKSNRGPGTGPSDPKEYHAGLNRPGKSSRGRRTGANEPDHGLHRRGSSSGHSIFVRRRLIRR